MNKLRTAISISSIGLILTLMFGGWSAVVAAAIVGAMVGLSYGQRSQLQRPDAIAQEALIPGLVASLITAAGAALNLFVVLPLTGQKSYSVSLYFFGPSVQLDSVLALIISVVLALIIGTGACYFFAYNQGLPNNIRTRQTLIGLGAFLLIFPFFEQITNLGWIGSLITVQIYILLALGLNIVVGYAGLLDRGLHHCPPQFA
jgi:branched-chain amino acid transport system permease protein